MFAILAKLVAAALAAGQQLGPLFAWVVAHAGQLQKAYTDWQAGANLEIIVTDLLAAVKAHAAQAPAFAAADARESLLASIRDARAHVEADDFEAAALDLCTACCLCGGLREKP